MRLTDLEPSARETCPGCHLEVNPMVLERVPAMGMLSEIPARIVLKCPRDPCQHVWYVKDKTCP